MDYEKIRSELEEIKVRNIGQMTMNYEKSKLAKVNNSYHKMSVRLIFALISYMSLLCLSFGLSRVLGAGFLGSIFPGVLFPLVFIGSSFGLGILGEKILYKKYRVLERFREFSKSKTRREKLLDEVRYEIEIEKIKNRNRTIDNAINAINLKQISLGKISDKDNMTLNDNFQSKKELEDIRRKLLYIMEGQYTKLDMLSTKKILHDKFLKTRKILPRLVDIIGVPYLNVLITSLVLAFPIMLSNSITGLSILLLLPSLDIVFISTFIYKLKKYNNYKRVFKELNLELGNNSLVYKFGKNNRDFDEINKIDLDIDNEIDNISKMVVQLQENEIYLEKNSEDEKLGLFNEFSQLNTIEKTVDEVFEKDYNIVSSKKRVLKKKRY